MKYGNEKHSIDVPSTILYGGSEEDLLNLIPLYFNAFRRWEASVNGVTPEDMEKASEYYTQYAELQEEIKPIQKKLEEAGENELDIKDQVEYSEKMNKLTQLSLKITREGGMKTAQFGLTSAKLELVQQNRKDLLSIINELIGAFASGLKKLDLETNVATIEEFMALREPDKKKLIYDVASDTQNGAPQGFIVQLGSITPVGINITS